MIRWYAVHTRPTAEAKAAKNLERQGYVTYLPRHRRWVRHARHRAITLRPLFPRYLFVAIDRSVKGWRPIRSTVGVAGIVCGADGPLPVPEGVVELVRGREGHGDFDELSPAQRLQAGDHVRITEGPFENVVGRLVSAGEAERVLVLFELLGRAVRTEIAAVSIEAV